MATAKRLPGDSRTIGERTTIDHYYPTTSGVRGQDFRKTEPIHAPASSQVVLTLSWEEAATLRILFQRVGGMPTGRRGHIDQISYALRDGAGVFPEIPSKHPDFPDQSGMYFHNTQITPTKETPMSANQGTPQTVPRPEHVQNAGDSRKW